MKKANKQKHQLIDDDSIFQLQELEGLVQDSSKLHPKQYQIVSVIGSQSSGKSSLLNSLFQTEFDVLNRMVRVGQTTKGIWYSVDTPSNIVILDVEGSDSNQREERTKIQRRNSLFALAISHTLLINLWIQQIGLYKGSQLAILEIILELNLKLFGSEKPKQIIFVIRDFVEKKENVEALRQKLFSKVEEAWAKIPKPPGKENISLSDLFELKAFFLPSKIQEREKQNWLREVGNLKKYLSENTKSKEVMKDNIPVTDLPRYMENIWHTIEQDKDINLPKEKVLLSNMRCQEIKKKVLEQYGEQFRDQLQKSERVLNEKFAANINKIIDKILKDYDEQTTGYIKEEIEKTRQQLIREVEGKVELSFRYQVSIISEECLRKFTDELNKSFAKQKSIDEVKKLKPKTIEEFNQILNKVSLKKEWEEDNQKKFEIQIQRKLDFVKEKIVSDSITDFDRILKKQMENAVSNSFYDRQTFTDNFWSKLHETYENAQRKARNSIQNLYTKLQINNTKNKANVETNITRASQFAKDELINYLSMKCIDLSYFVTKHFSSEFNNEGDIPRQWQSTSVEQIHKLFDGLKSKYVKLIDKFQFINLDGSFNQTKSKLRQPSMIIKQTNSFNQQLLSDKQLGIIKKKVEENMNNELQEALRKNKQVYSASIPIWAWILFVVVALDDILLWLSSPMLAIPLTLLLIVIVLAFLLGGKSFASQLFGNISRAASQLITSATTTAATAAMRND